MELESAFYPEAQMIVGSLIYLDLGGSHTGVYVRKNSCSVLHRRNLSAQGSHENPREILRITHHGSDELAPVLDE